MATAVSEMASIVSGIFVNVLWLSMCLFILSMIMKYNYYQKTNKAYVCVVLIFFAIYPVSFAYWYLLGGARGHFIPRGMPAFPYLYSQPQINNINYLVAPANCDKKDFPTLPDDKRTYSFSLPRNNWLFNNFIGKLASPPGHTEDADMIDSPDNSRVDALIFGEREGRPINPCDRNYLGIYGLNSWNK